MTLDQLRVFVAVAERQHVTRAAEALNLGQSAVSAAIAALESRYGTKLFHRVGRGITLTQAGEVFLGSARAILAQTEAAQLLLVELGGGKRGTLSIQASQTISSYWLPRHLVAFRQRNEGIEIRLGTGNSAQVALAVQRGEAELGFIEGHVEDSGLHSMVVARDKMLVVVSPRHPWAHRADISNDDIPKAEWVMREPGSGTRSQLEQAIAGFGVPVKDLRVAMELPSNEAVRAAVEAGLGVTALSATVAAPSLEAGLLAKVNLDLPERDFHVVRHPERFHSHAADAFLDMVTARKA